MKALHIFRAGTHRTNQGEPIAFSEADLAATVAAYAPAVHEAPICVGHPKHDAPAYGWIGRLAQAEIGLTATPTQVDPEFAEAVESGRFKKLSAAFYAPDDEANPVPGVYYLRHVAFLGAQPPAVKGLRNVEFGEGDGDAALVFEFAEWSDVANGNLWRRVREWMIAKFGPEEAETVTPSWLVDDVQAKPDPVPSTPLFTEPEEDPNVSNTPDITARQAELDERERQLKAREATIAAAEGERRAAAAAEFAETQVQAGRILPGEKAGVAAVLMALPDGDKTIAFGEGDAAESVSPRAFAERLLAGLPKRVDFSERSAPETTPDGQHHTFPVPAGCEVSPEGAKLHSRAVAFAEANGCSYEQAVAKVATNQG